MEIPYQRIVNAPPPLLGTDLTSLTAYENNRLPRTPVQDESTTTLQIRLLNSELTCPVCLGILHNTMTVMECLHRFCAACISKALRLGKRECPTCRVKCSSTRHLRPDPNIDNIINEIYPNLDEYEAKEETMIAEMNKQIMSNNFIRNSQEGKRKQALAKIKVNRSMAIRKSPPEDSSASKNQVKKRIPAVKTPLPQKKLKPETTPVNNNTNNSTPVEKKSSELSFVLLVHPEEKELKQIPNKYIRTSRLLTMRHLGKFLGKKFDLERKFSISLSPTTVPIAEEITLDYIEKNLWNEEFEITLYYRTQ